MYNCSKCLKYYETQSGLAKHEKTKHQNDFSCYICNKKFNRKYNMKRHLTICDQNNNNTNSKETIKMVKKYKMSKSDANKLISLTNSIANVHDSDIQNIQHSNNNHHNNIQNNIQNNIHNNQNIQIIVKLGDEDLENVFSPQEQRKVLNQRCGALEYLVKYTHFNEKYPEFQNILIDDLKCKYAKVYDTDKEDYLIINRDKMLDELILHRLNDIIEFSKINSELIGDRTKNIIKQYTNRLENELDNNKSDYIKDKKESLKMVIYNESDIINSNKKKKKLKLKKNSI